MSVFWLRLWFILCFRTKWRFSSLKKVYDQVDQAYEQVYDQEPVQEQVYDDQQQYEQQGNEQYEQQEYHHEQVCTRTFCSPMN